MKSKKNKVASVKPKKNNSPKDILDDGTSLKSKVIKIVAFVLLGAIILSSVFIIRACSAPPEYSEIRERVEYLINASHDVNDVIWGAGLDCYERVYDPQGSLDFFETDKTYTDEESGEEKKLSYYYYRALPEDKKVYAYSESHLSSPVYKYAYLSAEKLDADALAELFPKGEEHPENELYYTELFFNDDINKYFYCVPYTEPKYDFYYTKADPEDYDYVFLDSDYNSVDKIKDYIKTVYASDYAESLYVPLFDGVLEGSFISKARYSTNFNYHLGGSVLTKLNTYEPLYEERRVYLFSTAEIDRDNSNSKSVIVKIDSYLPSDPDKNVVAKIELVLDNDSWFLASPTY